MLIDRSGHVELALVGDDRYEELRRRSVDIYASDDLLDEAGQPAQEADDDEHEADEIIAAVRAAGKSLLLDGRIVDRPPPEDRRAGRGPPTAWRRRAVAPAWPRRRDRSGVWSAKAG